MSARRYSCLLFCPTLKHSVCVHLMVTYQRTMQCACQKYQPEHPHEFMMNGRNLAELDAFTYIGYTLSKYGILTQEIKTRIALAMPACNIIWKISFQIHVKLYRALAASSLFCGCESGTLSAETEKRVQTFEMKCFRRLLCIPHTKQVTKEYVRHVESLAGKHTLLLSTVKRRKLSLFWPHHLTQCNLKHQPARHP